MYFVGGILLLLCVVGWDGGYRGEEIYGFIVGFLFCFFCN